jgi:DNA-binding transcriptional regulator YiaG
MKPGSKYEPLYRYLLDQSQDKIVLSFTTIETLVGKLPRTARTARAFWSNRTGGAQAAAWMEAKYHVIGVDFQKQRVTFEKPIRPYAITRQGDTVVWNGALVKMLREHMGLNQAEFAQVLQVRQQTVSEWETGMYAPRRSTSKLLTLVAERAEFTYGQSDKK